MVEEIFAIREKPEEVILRRFRLLGLVLLGLGAGIIVHNILLRFIINGLRSNNPALINNWSSYLMLFSIFGLFHGIMSWATGTTISHVLAVLRVRHKILETSSLMLIIWGLLLIIDYLIQITQPVTLQEFSQLINKPPSVIELVLYVLPITGYLLMGIGFADIAKRLGMLRTLRIGSYIIICGGLLFILDFGWIILSIGLLIASLTFFCLKLEIITQVLISAEYRKKLKN